MPHAHHFDTKRARRPAGPPEVTDASEREFHRGPRHAPMTMHASGPAARAPRSPKKPPQRCARRRLLKLSTCAARAGGRWGSATRQKVHRGSSLRDTVGLRMATRNHDEQTSIVHVDGCASGCNSTLGALAHMGSSTARRKVGEPHAAAMQHQPPAPVRGRVTWASRSRWAPALAVAERAHRVPSREALDNT